MVFVNNQADAQSQSYYVKITVNFCIAIGLGLCGWQVLLQELKLLQQKTYFTIVTTLSNFSLVFENNEADAQSKS